MRIKIRSLNSALNKFKTGIQGAGFTPYIVIAILSFVLGIVVTCDKGKAEVKVFQSNDVFVTQIKAVGKMELTKLTVSDIVQTKIDRSVFDLFNSDLQLLVSGTITGCIDLSKISKEDISQGDSIITINLPLPEICAVEVNHKKSKVFYKNTWKLLDNDAELLDLSYKKAEVYFRSDSISNIAIKETEKNIDVVLKPILENICGRKIKLIINRKKILS